MKSPRLWFNIILLTWTIVNCEEQHSDVAISATGLTEDTEDTDFVNPFSFDYDRANKRMFPKQEAKFGLSDGVCVSDGQCRKELKQCKDALDNTEFDRLFTMRLINLLLSTVEFQEDGDVLTGSITLSGTKAQIEELREFGNGKITMRQVDAILSHMIMPSSNILVDTFAWIDHLFITVDQYRTISLAVLAAIAVLLLVKYVNWSTSKIVMVFLAVGFLISFFVTWSRLMKEAELKHMLSALKHEKPPIECEPEKMWFWDRLLTRFSGHDTCFEYYKAINFNAFEEVTLADAFIEVWDGIIYQSIIRFGSVYGLFIENATRNLWFPLNWVITIFLYVFLPGVIYCICGGRIRLWAGFCGIAIGDGERSQRQQQVPMIEQRDRIMIIERDSEGRLRQLATETVTHSFNDNKLSVGDGDAKTQKEEAKPEISGTICSTCCCKESLNKSHAQIEQDTVNKPTEIKVRSKEKGDGDC